MTAKIPKISFLDKNCGILTLVLLFSDTFFLQIMTFVR